MRAKAILLTLSTLFCALLSSCSHTMHDNTSAFYDDGRKKPAVALVPVVNSSGAQVGWDLSEEFTALLMQKLSKNSQFRLASQDSITTLTTSFSELNDPFSSNIDWIKNAFSGYEFVVFSELIDHDVRLKPLKGNFLDHVTPSSEVAMTLRLRIFDLRSETPKVILQEMINSKNTIAKTGDLSLKSPDYWKKLTFQITPLGIAHSQLVKNATARIEDYVKISQSH